MENIFLEISRINRHANDKTCDEIKNFRRFFIQDESIPSDYINSKTSYRMGQFVQRWNRAVMDVARTNAMRLGTNVIAKAHNSFQALV